MRTREQEIVEIVGSIVENPTTALALPNAHTALAIKEAVAAPLLAHPTYAPLWTQFQADPKAQAPILVGVIQVILQADLQLAGRLESLLAQYQQQGGNVANYHAEGGMFFAPVSVTGGDFVARDQTKTINETASDPTTFAQAFALLYEQIARQPTLPPQEKAVVQEELKAVETELKKDESASEPFIQERLRNIERMAPDILEVILATFANPILGLGLVAKKIADKMKGEAAPAA